jgi:hypothetical protein
MELPKYYTKYDIHNHMVFYVTMVTFRINTENTDDTDTFSEKHCHG